MTSKAQTVFHRLYLLGLEQSENGIGTSLKVEEQLLRLEQSENNKGNFIKS